MALIINDQLFQFVQNSLRQAKAMWAYAQSSQLAIASNLQTTFDLSLPNNGTFSFAIYMTGFANAVTVSCYAIYSEKFVVQGSYTLALQGKNRFDLSFIKSTFAVKNTSAELLANLREQLKGNDDAERDSALAHLAIISADFDRVRDADIEADRYEKERVRSDNPFEDAEVVY